MSWLGSEEPRSAMTLRRASRLTNGSGPRTHPTLKPAQNSLLIEPTVMKFSAMVSDATAGGASSPYIKGPEPSLRSANHRSLPPGVPAHAGARPRENGTGGVVAGGRHVNERR
jgi:hypothetical protein